MKEGERKKEEVKRGGEKRRRKEKEKREREGEREREREREREGGEWVKQRTERR